MGNLYIVAVFHFKEETSAAAKTVMEKLVTETRKEEGCLQYDLVEDNARKGIYFIVELWESTAHHAKHDETEHLNNFRTQAGPLMKSSAEVYKGAKIF